MREDEVFYDFLGSVQARDGLVSFRHVLYIHTLADIQDPDQIHSLSLSVTDSDRRNRSEECNDEEDDCNNKTHKSNTRKGGFVHVIFRLISRPTRSPSPKHHPNNHHNKEDGRDDMEHVETEEIHRL